MEEKPCKVAAIDLGTQTFRLLAAELTDTGPRIVASIRENVRLGQGLDKKGAFSIEAMERARAAMNILWRNMKRLGITKVRAIGTEAFRRAENVNDLLEIAKDVGIDIDIIDPSEETTLSVKGAYLTIPTVKNPWLMLDSGGGSTELAICNETKVEAWTSLKLGAVSVAEELKRKGAKNALETVREKVTKELSSKGMNFNGVNQIIATGGTATTVSAVLQCLSPYDPQKVRGHRITVQELQILFERMNVLSIEERKKIMGLEPERADIFPSGIAILLEIVRYVNLNEITVSDGGILLGLLSTILEKECRFHVEPSSARSLYV